MEGRLEKKDKNAGDEKTENAKGEGKLYQWNIHTQVVSVFDQVEEKYNTEYDPDKRNGRKGS